MGDEELEPLLTQCPNCDTRFKVSEAQLRVAQGQVRCGACLGVFDATVHLLLDGDEVAAVEESEDVDALLLEIDAQAERVLSDDAQPADTSAEASENQANGINEVEADELALIGPERDADAALAALEAELISELKQVPAAEPIEADPSPADELDTETSFPDELALPLATTRLTPQEEAAAEQWAAAPAGAESALVAEPATAEHPAPSPAGTSAQGHAAAASPRPPQPDIPLELLYDEPSETPRRSWVSVLILLVALIGLPAQVLWYKFDDWGKHDMLRPVYAQICHVLGCELPVRRNVGLINARSSVLRDHPEVEQALVYDTLLVNQAHYAQPYPLVELTLLTVRGQLVATRRFKPHEYLSGEVSPSSYMEPLTPVHISLAIEDPGEKPLNFKVRFLPNDAG